MTAFIANIRTSDLEMAFANAGHNLPLFCATRNGGTPERDGGMHALLARGPRLGDAAEDRFEEKRMRLDPGMLLFWYTDGLLDCVNESGESYGKKRMLQVLRTHSDDSSPTIRDALVQEITQFSGQASLPDDVTFIVGKTLT